MVTSRDEIKEFIPEKEARLVILGTMASIPARTVNGQSQDKPFYYHSRQNHFWKVIQLVYEANIMPRDFLTVEIKKDFLNRRQIAMANLVYEINVKESESRDPSDIILFKAHDSGRLKFKTSTERFKRILRTTPILFTCRGRNPIRELIGGYLRANGLEPSISGTICHLPSPTRCNPTKRSAIWMREIGEHFQKFDFNPL